MKKLALVKKLAVIITASDGEHTIFLTPELITKIRESDGDNLLIRQAQIHETTPEEVAD